MRPSFVSKGILFVGIVVVCAMVFSSFVMERKRPISLRDEECAFNMNPIPELSDAAVPPPVRNPFAYPKTSIEVQPSQPFLKASEGNMADSLVYKGLIEINGQKTAIIVSAQKKKTVFAKEGDDVFGYKVVDISENSIVLSESGSMSLITLKVGGGGGRD